jgi:hypothetical protein
MPTTTIAGVTVRAKHRAAYLCSVPKITSLFSVAGIHARFIAGGGQISRRQNQPGVWITCPPTYWDAELIGAIIEALTEMDLHVHVHPTDGKGRGGAVELQVVPGGWLGGPA